MNCGTYTFGKKVVSLLKHHVLSWRCMVWWNRSEAPHICILVLAQDGGELLTSFSNHFTNVKSPPVCIGWEAG